MGNCQLFISIDNVAFGDTSVSGLTASFKMTEPTIHKVETTNVYNHLKDSLSMFRSNYRLRVLSLSKIIGYAQGETGYQFRSAFISLFWLIWVIATKVVVKHWGYDPLPL